MLSFNKLTDLEHVSVIFTGYSGPSLAMAPLATRKKVLLVNAGAQADALSKASPYLINTLPTIGDEIAVLSKWLVEQGKKQGAIMFENDAAGMSGAMTICDRSPMSAARCLHRKPRSSARLIFARRC